MRVTSCNFNHIFLELNFELSQEEFCQSEDVMKEMLLCFAEDVLKKFEQTKNIVISKCELFEDDMSVLCVFLFK
ncbi:hypothetical protein [Priestia flexa]|uniref:hypothetical protein n=1 Tax=Priestia flexa TaxID=86664 RepID=UPI00099DE180|nr:hypothetical protein [Priestia flexa]AQX56124.1 hypothetical protein BC359_18735 [Priestia flexa]